jgi:hypothetical protein
MGASLTGSSEFSWVGDRVGAWFEDAEDDTFWGDVDSCGFVGPSGNTVGGAFEELEVQDSHFIFFQMVGVVFSKTPIAGA